MVRLLEIIIDQIDLDRVLLDLHRFLKEFPSSHWKGRPKDDLPLRTVKTILHTLAKLKGNKVKFERSISVNWWDLISTVGQSSDVLFRRTLQIMSHLTLIEDLQDSEIEPYLQKVLKGGVRHRNPSSNDGQQQQHLSTADSSHGSQVRHSPRRLSKTTHEMLADIFKKIGSKETTKEVHSVWLFLKIGSYIYI